MAITNNDITYFVDALTLTAAGNEFAAALATPAMLSKDTFNRLVIAMSDAGVAAHIQMAILGGAALTPRDIQYLTDGLTNAGVAAAVVAAIAGSIANTIS